MWSIVDSKNQDEQFLYTQTKYWEIISQIISCNNADKFMIAMHLFWQNDNDFNGS